MQRLHERAALRPALEAALDRYDPETAAHSLRVGRAAVALGRALGLSGFELAALAWAGALHDIGKIGVPHPILTKQGPLDADEWAEVRRHPYVGAGLLIDVSPALEPIAEAIRSHHERWDGSGYPDGLSGASIPIAGRVIAVVDAFDAMVSARPYHRALSPERAHRELRAGAGSQFDPTVVDHYLLA